MKVKVTTNTNEDCKTNLTIEINDIQLFNVGDGEPEDNNLNRNFNDCYIITNLLKAAHEAGLRGESLDIETIETEEP